LDSKPLLDPAPLLAPLLLDEPCGADLRYDQVYDKIPELGRCEAEGLPMGVWERESKKSDWPAVVALCTEVLSTRTKDMQIAAWLGQALTRLHGPRGAALGWRIFSSLTTTFWHDIHPRIDNKDANNKDANNKDANNKDAEIRLCAVYWFAKQTDQWLTEYLASTVGDRDAQEGTESTSAEGLAALTSLLQELEQLQLFLDQQLGQQTSLFHQLIEPLQRRLSTIKALPQATLANAIAAAQSGDQSLAAVPITLANAIAAAQSGDQALAAVPIQLKLNSRDAAYAALGDIARVLAKAEPHSPVPMILEALVSWRDCQFSDLLTRMPQDKASLYELLKFFKQP
jgi:type VI secretion system protein ImpA